MINIPQVADIFSFLNLKEIEIAFYFLLFSTLLDVFRKEIDLALINKILVCFNVFLVLNGIGSYINNLINQPLFFINEIKVPTITIIALIILFVFAIINTYQLERDIKSAFDIFVLFNEITIYLFAIMKLISYLINVEFTSFLAISVLSAIVFMIKISDIIVSNLSVTKNN